MIAEGHGAALWRQFGVRSACCRYQTLNLQDPASVNGNLLRNEHLVRGGTLVTRRSHGGRVADPWDVGTVSDPDRVQKGHLGCKFGPTRPVQWSTTEDKGTAAQHAGS